MRLLQAKLVRNLSKRFAVLQIGAYFYAVPILFCLASAFNFGWQFMDQLGHPIFSLFAFALSLNCASRIYQYAAYEHTHRDQN